MELSGIKIAVFGLEEIECKQETYTREYKKRTYKKLNINKQNSIIIQTQKINLKC